MQKAFALALTVTLSVIAASLTWSASLAARVQATPQAQELDRLLAPIALYPDRCSHRCCCAPQTPAKVAALSEWLAANQTLKGTELQDAATKSGFEPEFCRAGLFPDVVTRWPRRWTGRRSLGQAFAADRSAVFASIQRLRAKAQ